MEREWKPRAGRGEAQGWFGSGEVGWVLKQ